MKGKIVSLKHARLKKRDEEMDERNKRERSTKVLIKNILRWWMKGGELKCFECTKYPYQKKYAEDLPEFVRIAKEIDEMGIDDWLLENAKERELIGEIGEKWTDV